MPRARGLEPCRFCNPLTLRSDDYKHTLITKRQAERIKQKHGLNILRYGFEILNEPNPFKRIMALLNQVEGG